MRRKYKRLAAFCCLSIGLIWTMTGCQMLGNSNKDSKVANVTEEKPPVEFISQDGLRSIMLPDDSWSVDEDTQDLCMFSSDSGLIMLTQTSGDEPVVPESEDDLKIILQKEGYNSKNYEVLEYEDWKIAELTSYRAVIKYDDPQATYAFGILYVTVIGDDEYMASAMLFSDDEAQMERVKESIYNYTSLPDKSQKDDKNALTPETIPKATPEPTPESTPEPTPEATPEPTPEATPEPTPEAAPESAPPAEPGPVIGTRVCAAAAYVRSAPDNASTILGTVEEAEVISVTAEVRNWYEISYAGSVGYVCKDYVQ